MHESIQPDVRSKEATAQKESLSDNDIYKMLASFGNSEAKALLLVLMEPGVIYTDSELHKLIMAAQTPVGWKIDHKVPAKYCNKSLSPIGLVVRQLKSTSNPEHIFGYAKTALGMEMELLAALLLDFSSNIKDVSLSLYDLLGSTRTPVPANVDEGERSRSPKSRLMLYWEIVSSSQNLSPVDLVNATGLSQSVVEYHLEELRRKKIIFYETIQGREARSVYQWDLQSDAPQPVRRANSLKNAIAEIIAGNPNHWWSAEEIAQNILKDTPLRANALSSMQHSVRTILREFKELNLVKDARVTFKVTLNQESQEMLEQLLLLIDNFKNQDPVLLQHAHNLVARFRGAPQKGILPDKAGISFLMTKAKESSPNANTIPVETSISTIARLVKEYPGKTSAELLILYCNHLNTYITQARLNKLLYEMAQSRQLHAVKVKVYHWYLPD